MVAPGKSDGNSHDVLERRATEGIDRLRIVADDHHVLMGGCEMPDDIRLQAIGVLILIHQDVSIQGRDGPTDRFVLHHEPPQQHQQIVIIHQLALTLRRLISPLQLAQCIQMVGKMIELFDHDLV